MRKYEKEGRGEEKKKERREGQEGDWVLGQKLCDKSWEQQIKNFKNEAVAEDADVRKVRRERNEKEAGMKHMDRGRGSEETLTRGGIGQDLLFLMQVISLFLCLAFVDYFISFFVSFLHCLGFVSVPQCRVKVVLCISFFQPEAQTAQKRKPG